MDNNIMELKLGDIISINAPNNDEIDNKTFLIEYIDSSVMRLLDTETLTTKYLNMDNGTITDESINSISVLSREEEEGYARQNDLVPGTWVQIKFGGDVPTIIVAKITDIEYDTIELTTYPEKDVIYIDFAYQGIPLDIPIEEIVIRAEPDSLKETTQEDIAGESEFKEGVDEVDKTEVLDDDDEEQYQDNSITLDVGKKELTGQIQEVLVEADELFFGDVEDIEQEVQVKETEKRYSLEEQTNDLLDEMLSTIPNTERTNKVLNKIHMMIERFTQLREMYSVRDENNVIIDVLKKTALYKPLVNSLCKLNKNIYWLLPIVKNKRKLYDIIDEGEEEISLNFDEDIIPSNTKKSLEKIEELKKLYRSGEISGSGNKYGTFMRQLLQEMEQKGIPEGEKNITTIDTNDNINVVLDNVVHNLRDFYSSVVKKQKVKKSRYVISKYGLSQNMLKAHEMRSSYMKTHRVKINNNDVVPLKGMMALPNKYINYSKINLPGTTIYDKTNLNHSSLSYWNMLRSKTSVVKNSITDIDKEVGQPITEMIDTIKSYVLDDELMNTDNETLKDKMYKKFLETFIPTTYKIFEDYKGYITDGVSIDAIIKQLEPFLIYREDLTIEQYKLIREYIEQNLLIVKQQLVINTKDTNIIRNLKLKVNLSNSILLMLLESQRQLAIEGYNIDNENTIYDGDFMTKMMTTDYGEYYNSIIRNMTKHLYVNINIKDELKKTFEKIEREVDGENTDNNEEITDCNLSEDNIALNDDCFAIEQSKDRILRKHIKEISNNIDEGYNLSDEMLRSQLSALSSILTDLVSLKKVIHLSNNNKFYKQGLDVTTEDIVISPYSELFNRILGQSDLSKRMVDINRFIETFTRSNNPDDNTESEFWYYCIETDTKLVPTFFGELALAFLFTNNFSYELDRICRERGEISDDGDKWVDKYSGYTIRMIDMNTEEGIDDAGYPLQTTEITEELNETLLNRNETTGDELQKTKEGAIVGNILNALMMYSGVEIKDRSAMVKGILLYTSKQIGTKEKYEKKVEAAELKGKKMSSYEYKRNQLYIMFSGIYFLIYIQTSIPSVRTRKTFPGCVKSFGGYPTFNDDTGGIEYISCIIKKISSSQSPWNTLKSVSEAAIQKNMKLLYNGFLSTDSEIMTRIQEKQEYLKSGENMDYIPEDIDVSNWNTFLPPLKPIEIRKPQMIDADFKKDLKTEMNKGSLRQIPMLSTIKSKILFFSLHIQNLIEDIIQKEENIMKTATGVPFLENMCCQTTDDNNAIKYFIEKDDGISEDNNEIKELRKIYNEIMNISKASVLIDKRDTKLKYPEISKKFGKKTIYRGFIEFCKMNKNEPIEDYLIPFCNDTTSKFDEFDTLEQKIEIMKSEGKNYDSDIFKELLNTINKTRVLTTHIDTIIPKTHERLIYILNNIKSKIENDTANVPNTLVSLLNKAISVVGEYSKDMKDETKNLKNFIITSTQKLRKDIIIYISENSSLSRVDKKKITEFLNNLDEFDNIESDGILTDKEETELHKIQFLQNSLYHLIREFPNIILNKVDYSNIDIHSHWNLSEIHKKDVVELVRKNYDDLKRFYGDEQLDTLLYEVQKMTIDIQKLIENTPLSRMNSKDEKDIFHLSLVKDLYIFYLYSVLEKYIQLEKLADDEEFAVVLYGDVDEDEDGVIDEERLQQRQEILQSNRINIQKTLSSLIGTYLLIFRRQKDRINMNREHILDLVNRSKEKEKNVKTRQLKELTDEERKADSELRKGKLGRWNIGLQKGLTQYVKGFYDTERSEMEKEAVIESKLGNITDVTNMNRDIYELQVVDEYMLDMETEQEAYDMSMFADDDDFGDDDGDEQF